MYRISHFWIPFKLWCQWPTGDGAVQTRNSSEHAVIVWWLQIRYWHTDSIQMPSRLGGNCEWKVKQGRGRLQPEVCLLLVLPLLCFMHLTFFFNVTFRNAIWRKICFCQWADLFFLTYRFQHLSETYPLAIFSFVNSFDFFLSKRYIKQQHKEIFLLTVLRWQVMFSLLSSQFDLFQFPCFHLFSQCILLSLWFFSHSKFSIFF